MANELSALREELDVEENELREGMEAFVRTGNALKRIRDRCLYKCRGFETWEAYLKLRVAEEFGFEIRQAQRMISAAIIRRKLPDPAVLASPVTREQPEWTPKLVNEFARLAPQSEDHAQRRDLDALRKQDVNRVIKTAVETAKELGKPVTAAIVRQAVNAELGREPAKREKPEPIDSGIDLPVYLRQKIGQIEGITEVLIEVPGEGWKQLERSHPQLAERLATVCDRLAGLLRS